MGKWKAGERKLFSRALPASGLAFWSTRHATGVPQRCTASVIDPSEVRNSLTSCKAISDVWGETGKSHSSHRLKTEIVLILLVLWLKSMSSGPVKFSNGFQCRSGHRTGCDFVVSELFLHWLGQIIVLLVMTQFKFPDRGSSDFDLKYPWCHEP